MARDLYMGFDLSTTQLKALVVDSNLKLVHEAQATFDEEFAKYGVASGVVKGSEPGEVFSPNAMWLEALDLVLEKLNRQGADFSRLRAVSGAGMQHGTVFWTAEADKLLQNLSGDKSLLEQLTGDDKASPSAFAHPLSPNWQDSSTQAQCDAFDARLKDKNTLADVTGSNAHHRFSGPQILKFREKNPKAYENTARISLVSSFLASVLLGKVAPIDISDVCGMNFWNIKERTWSKDLLALAAGDGSEGTLKQKLGDVPEDGGGSFGKISKYFVQRYGFNAECDVAPFTGDNPATILSLPLRASDAIVSLGTSTTFLMSTGEYKPDPAYHFMNHPTTAGLYMFMLCYKNGSGARENIRDELNVQAGAAQKSWDTFNETIQDKTSPLNQSDDTDTMKMGLFFPMHETVPSLPAGSWTYLYNNQDKSLKPITPQSSSEPAPSGAESSPWVHPTCTARAVLESQFLSCRLRSAPLVHPQPNPRDGSTLPAQPRRIYLVGGGSVNPVIAQVCGEVLGGAEGVYKLDIGGNACALGAAYKAVWARERKQGELFEDFIGARWDEAGFVKKVDVGYRAGLWERYGEAVVGFEAMEKEIIAKDGTGRK